MMAKNIMISVGGETPYRAVFGRSPPMLREFESPTVSMVVDEACEPVGGTRHAARVREIALQQMIETTAQLRMK